MDRKIKGVGGGLTTGLALSLLAVWLLGHYQPALMATASPEIVLVLGTLFTNALGMLSGWFTRSSPNDPSRNTL